MRSGGIEVWRSAKQNCWKSDEVDADWAPAEYSSNQTDDAVNNTTQSYFSS